ncbi:MAG: hypothetical protein JWM68_3584 [Verrucomicrobiales bacterium]|nr:hypothetical protein [Verrucomicrobiales bacterium]
MADAVKNSQAPIGAGECVHQALHGYAEGHRLIESSLSLPDDLVRLVLRMSDLSGSDIVNGFEDYITGYPLSSIGMYALAKTWYAPEMPRPGCVWTHTLFIPEGYLKVPSLSVFLKMFRRPAQRAATGLYSDTLAPNSWSDGLNSKTASIPMPPDTAQFLSLFYSEDFRPILIPAQTSQQYEEMLFAVWSQQWPNLRKVFTFSTGSLSGRRFLGRPLDVQCVPMALLRDVQLETAPLNAEPITLNSERISVPKWAIIAAADTQNENGGELRRFIWDFADSGSKRQDFVSLMRIYDVLHDRNTDDLVALIAELFPQPSLGGRLKTLLFGRTEERTLLRHDDEAAILLALGLSDNYSAFDATTLGLKERGGALSLDYNSARLVIDQLFRSTINPLGGEILAGLISALDPKTAREITSEQPRFISSLFAAKPSLAASHQLWSAAGDRKRDLFESLVRQQSLDSEVLTGIVSALLESGSEMFLRRAFEKWGKDAVFAAMDWIAAGGKMSETCRVALTYYVPTVMDWLEVSTQRTPWLLASAARIVAPYTPEICTRDTGLWCQALDENAFFPLDGEPLYFSTFILALGLCNAPSTPLSLVRLSFERVYNAAWNDQLSDNSWEILDSIVPHLSWPNDWDKCERMSRGLVSAFVRHNWPPLELPLLVSSSGTLNRILRSAEKVNGGENFLKSLRYS